MKITSSEIQAMHGELISQGKIAAGEAYAVCCYPSDLAAVKAMQPPAVAEIWLTRVVPMGYVYVLTLGQASDSCPREAEPIKAGQG
jgi:hypothetical protein